MLKFYFTPDTCCLATLIVLEDVSADYLIEVIDFGSQMQSHAALQYISVGLATLD